MFDRDTRQRALAMAYDAIRHESERIAYIDPVLAVALLELAVHFPDKETDLIGATG